MVEERNRKVMETKRDKEEIDTKRNNGNKVKRGVREEQEKQKK